MRTFVKKTKLNFGLVSVFIFLCCVNLKAQHFSEKDETASEKKATVIVEKELKATAYPCDLPYNLRTFNYTFLWDAGLGAFYYTLEYKPASASTWTVIDFINDTRYTTTNLASGTLYDWRVRANCEKESSEYVSAQFYTPAKCGNFKNLTTTNITGNSATLNWVLNGDPNDLARILIEYKAINSSTWIIINTNNSAINYNLTGLSSGTTYDWRIRTLCLENELPGIYSTSQFSTPFVCNAAPTGLLGEAINTCGDVQLSWDAVPGAQSYTLELKKTTSTSWIVIETAYIGTYYQLNLVPGLYNWRVKANCELAGANYSESTVRSIFRPRGGCVNLRKSKNIEVKENEISHPITKIKLSPLPASKMMNISFSSKEKNNTKLEIVDLQGKKVQEKTITVTEGQNQFSIDVSELKNGIYIVRFTNGTMGENAKLVIQK